MQPSQDRPVVDRPVAGVLLAAGAGRRFGKPKALAGSPEEGSWLERGVSLLLDAGCAPVVVVLGAGAEEARALIPAGDARVVPVVAPDWEDGVGASLRAAFDALELEPAPVAALITLVDLPHLTASALRRVLDGGAAPSMLRRAVYAGKPGHPVLIGRDHWDRLRPGLSGDVGAAPYLRQHGAEPIDCTGLGGDDDVDTPPEPTAPSQRRDA
ncbi:nucleotidyltransferase family protein [Sinomonas gamaensis]|uniref:nucleotidyltransferase family protein n=1 Tax=Sinomonas gamaensis TaxID=2565624 RepID=UPI001BB2B129|nr:nucleotidyltransferase family protein [Sinomonas gamaensis]